VRPSLFEAPRRGGHPSRHGYLPPRRTEEVWAAKIRPPRRSQEGALGWHTGITSAAGRAALEAVQCGSAQSAAVL